MKLKKISKGERKELEEGLKKTGNLQGLNNSALPEDIPTPLFTSSEVVFEGKNNSFIVCGRDRPDVPESGFGGIGANDCGRIDLIAGIAATRRDNDGEYNTTTSETAVSPSFATTASRLYITQRGDIDAYMGLAEGVRQQSYGRSAIAAKADLIRLHARYDVKIVTGRGKFEGLGKDGERLSTGGKNEVLGTISFIAGNYTQDKDVVDFNMLNSLDKKRKKQGKLQPLVKGENLVDLLEEMIEYINELSTMVGQNTKSISKMNNAIASHSHISPVGPTSMPLTYALTKWPTLKMSKTIHKFNDVVFRKNLKLTRLNYLNQNTASRYINSKYVFTT